MFVELTQISYNPSANTWVPGRLTITSKAVVGFYPQEEEDGPCVLLLAGNYDPILVQESYNEVKELLTPPVELNIPEVEEDDPGVIKPFIWIPCDEHLPDRDGSYLVTTSRQSYSVDIGIFKDGKWRVPGVKIIAWMDVPRPSWYQPYSE